ncbi:MAG: hypothetical protein ACREN3_10510, partial [Gemmatimonadaceae bacterium]
MSAIALYEIEIPGPAAGDLTVDRRLAQPTEGGPVCVGISFRTAPLALRERLVIPESGIEAALSRFGCGNAAQPSAIRELVILSTCNRLELYAAGGTEADQALFELIEDATGVPSAEWRGASYMLSGSDAVR